MTRDTRATADQAHALWIALVIGAMTDPATPCLDRKRAEWWHAEDAEQRRQAAQLCHLCPLMVQCDAYAVAAGERYGTWGGKDRTPVDGRRRVAA